MHVSLWPEGSPAAFYVGLGRENLHFCEFTRQLLSKANAKNRMRKIYASNKPIWFDYAHT
jgi:hypothetical protein